MKKDYNTLYSRDSLGNIRIWKMEQNEGKYRTISGLQNGEQVTSEWTVAEGKNQGKKNETTDVEQATKEIEAKYKKQKKTGYFENIDDVDDMNYIEPMLAKNYKDYQSKIDINGWGVQTKYNGICCVATKNGCFTRKGERFLSVSHIEKSLTTFFDKYPNSFLHGELFNDNYREQLNEIVKLCRKTVNLTDKDLKNSEDLIRFYIYDGCFPENSLDENASYSKRKEFIDNNVVNNYDYCMKVPTTLIKCEQDLDKMFETAICRGDEGLILRNMDMKYEHKRSKNLLKYKPMESDEMVIVDIKEGTGNWSCKAKIISVRMKNGEIFDATFKGDMESAQQFLTEKDQWIGKEVTIHFFGYTGLGCPQYAQLDINNCLRVEN